MVKVKICGIKSPEALQAATEAGADWVGFNFFPPSPRYVTPDQAAAMPGGPERVGLFVEPSDDEIAATLAAVRLDVLQVYADTARIEAIRARFGLPVWQGIGVQSRADLPTVAATDALLVDAKPPKDSSLPGGNASSFDWSILRGWAAPVPWLLAGGLTPTNVAAAIRISGAAAVDVSSGVERSRGVKDSGLMRAFVEAAKGPVRPNPSA